MIHRLSYRTRLLILTLGLSAAPYFVNLGVSSLWDTNEAFYAETPREMIESGNFGDPTFNYRPRLNKPPLSYWIVAASYRLFGMSERSERIPIAIGAMILIATAYGLGASAAGKAARSVEAGLISAIALAANPRFLFFARRIIIDVYVALFLGLALLFFILALGVVDKGREYRRRFYLVMMYVSIGLAVITKGPIGVVLPALVFVIYVLTAKRASLFKQILLPAGAVIVCAIVLPWYVVVYLNHGWGQISSFLLGDNLSRYTSGTWGPSRSVLFYVPVVLGDLFPWSLVLIPALAVSLAGPLKRAWHQVSRTLRRTKHIDVRGEFKGGFEVLRMTRESKLLLLLWILVIVAFFSLSKGKEDLYILPIYPAAMAIVGIVLSRLVDCDTDSRHAAREAHRADDDPPPSVSGTGSAEPGEQASGGREPGAIRTLSWILAGAGMAMSAAGCVVLYLRGIVPPTLRLSGVLPISAAAICGGTLIVAAIVMKRRFLAVLAMMLVTAAVNWIIVLRMLPDYERFQPVPAMAEIIRGRAGDKARVCYFKYPAPSLVYYLRRGIYEYSDDQRAVAQEMLSSFKEVYCLTPESELENLRAGTGPLFILARRPLFKLKLKGIHSGYDPPQLILVSNRSE